jgi:hypothetical protein
MGGGWELLEPVGVFRCPGMSGGSLAGSAHASSLEETIAASASACGFGYPLAPAAGLYVAVRGIGRAAARGHVHIADSVAMPKPAQ